MSTRKKPKNNPVPSKPTRKMTSSPKQEITEKSDSQIERARRTLNSLPREKREVLVQEITSVSYSGPIPHPSDFEQYERVLPGAADRILTMAENQSAHRQTLEKAAIYSDVENSKRWQWFGFLIGIVCICGGFVLIAMDKDLSGFALIGGSIGTLVGIFVYGRKSDAKERKEKNDSENS